MPITVGGERGERGLDLVLGWASTREGVWQNALTLWNDRSKVSERFHKTLRPAHESPRHERTGGL